MSYSPLVVLALFSTLLCVCARPEYAFKQATRDLNLNLNVSVSISVVTSLIASITAPVDCSTFKFDPVKYPYIKGNKAAGDKRGPCPGLNSLANHGYIPRNGIVTLLQLRLACVCIAGFTEDFTAALLATAFSSNGDIIADKLSIGSADGNGFIQTNQGLDYHAGIEVDSSLTRLDWYFGDNSNLNVPLWNQLVTDAENRPDQWSRKSFSDARYKRYLQSNATNPIFVYTPKTFLIAAATAQAAWASFRNGSGIPTTASMTSWFIDERIPDDFTVSKTTSLIDAVNAFYDFYWDHPVDLSSGLLVPRRRECMKCFLRSFFMQLVYGANINIVDYTYSTFLVPYCGCTDITC